MNGSTYFALVAIALYGWAAWDNWKSHQRNLALFDDLNKLRDQMREELATMRKYTCKLGEIVSHYWSREEGC